MPPEQKVGGSNPLGRTNPSETGLSYSRDELVNELKLGPDIVGIEIYILFQELAQSATSPVPRSAILDVPIVSWAAFSGLLVQQREKANTEKKSTRHPGFLEAHRQAIAEASAWGPKAEPALSYDQKLSLIQQKINYVFVIYQENRSFDSYFGTFPGRKRIPFGQNLLIIS